jgi:uroporphyrin-III C-methyltransferase
MSPGTTLLEAGEVALVGAGPGDPELLTLRALKLMEQADVVVYDRLVSDDVMAFVPTSAERRYVGKQVGCHALQQPEINALLVELAKNGKRVVRLKGGDPFVFGRGGEEVEALLAAAVPCRVVPGITSAAACTAYAGIPLTHRGCAQSVSFITGHLKNGELQLAWDALAREGQTLVFYMGLFNADTISKNLQQHGMSPAMPVALIERGTTPLQRSHLTTLESLPGAVAEHGFRPPTLIVVGQVVTLFAQHAAGYGSFKV